MRRIGICFLLINLFAISLLAQDSWYLSVYDSIGDIEARVDTTYGTYAIGTHREEQPLTYQFDRTSMPYYYGESSSFMVNIGGTIYRSATATGGTDSIVVIDEYYLGSYIEDNRIISAWEIPWITGSFMIYQRLIPTRRLAEDTTLGMIRIEYEVENRTMMPIPVGLKMVLNPQFASTGAIGPYYTDVGVFFNDGDYDAIPTAWQVFEEGIEDTSDQLIARCDMSEDIPNQFGLGQWVMPGIDLYGIAERKWDEGTPPDWEGEPYTVLGAMLRWNFETLDTGSSRSFTTYYGHGRAIRSGCEDCWALFSDFPAWAAASECSLESIVDVNASITNIIISTDSAESTIVCIDLPAAGGLMYEGRTCDTLGTLYALETAIMNLQFRIPDGYSAFESQHDTITIHITSTTPAFEEITLERVFTTPYFDGTPPDVDFLFEDSLYIHYDEEFACFEASDEDTTINTETIRVDLIDDDELYSVMPESGLLVTIDGTTYIQLENIMVTLYGDTLQLEGFVDICITQLQDHFGCGIDTICRTVELPSLGSIDLELHEGWNMVSLPIEREYWDSSLFPESIAPIYTFDPGEGLYEESETVEIGTGFWYFSNTDTTLTIENYFSSRAIWRFLPGWNIIGMPYQEVSIDTLLPDDIIPPAYHYEPMDLIYEVLRILNYGESYYLYSSDSLEIVIE